MATETKLARRYKWEVNTGTVAVPVWTAVLGIVEFKPSTEPVNQLDFDYDADGNKGYKKTAQEWAIEAKISVKQDDGTFVTAAVHTFLKTASRSFGAASVVHMRYYDRNGNSDAWEGYGIIGWSDEGGDAEQLGQATITVQPSSTSPDLTNITNPLNLTPVALISSVSPTGGGTAGGTLVIISGAYFTGTTGATGVKFGATNATSYSVVSDSKIAAIAPAGSAGTVQVIVANGNGNSANTAADDYTYA